MKKILLILFLLQSTLITNCAEDIKRSATNRIDTDAIIQQWYENYVQKLGTTDALCLAAVLLEFETDKSVLSIDSKKAYEEVEKIIKEIPKIKMNQFGYFINEKNGISY